MGRFIIYSKDGQTQRCIAEKLEYNGEFMGACSVNITVTSPTPIDFEVGDYLTYREERFEINYDPTELKQAAKNTYGEAFKYENVVFNSLADELTRCEFLDYVKEDNLIHYSSLSTFSFYAENINALAERIQVNLDRIYKGEQKWTVAVHSEYVNDANKSISISNINVWDALALANSEFNANFIIRGRTITIGTAGIAVGSMFGYGKGKGLYSIQKTADSSQKIITRLRAYGSTRNLPTNYYAVYGKPIVIAPIEEADYGYTPDTHKIAVAVVTLPFEMKFISSMEKYDVTINGKSYKMERANYLGKCNVWLNSENDKNYVKVGASMRIEEGIFTDNVPRKYKRPSGALVPNNMAVKNLMLPDFPGKTLDPYLDSKNIDAIGVREGSVFFDGSDSSLPEIYPSMEGMTAQQLIDAGISVNATGALDEIAADSVNKDNTAITDDGYFEEGETIPPFKIYLKDIGFDINDYLTGETATISMKSGMCGGREFEILGDADKPIKQGNMWVLTCNRTYDEGLNLYFPYKDFKIKAGDKFVLLGIDMPDVYIKAASQRLLTASKEYLAKNDYVRYTYEPKVDEIFMARHPELHDSIKEGDLMLFEDEDLNINGSIIIDSLTIKEGDGLIPTYGITLRNDKAVGTLEKIQNQIDSIVGGQGGGGLTTQQVESIIKAFGDKLFLNKTKPDQTSYLVKFLGGLFSDYIQSMNFSSGALGEGFVIKVDSKTGDSYLEVDHMLARKSATFIELLIQRLRQVGGQIILSPASMSCSKVEEYDTFYRCYFENTDGEKTIVQEFVVGDQARSQTFNIKPGVHENVSNTYYWRLVTSIGDNYIDLSKSDCDTGSAAPQAGDDIVQLGNRTDKTRQNAIVLAAYGNDTPSFRQYAGIDSYSLAGKEVTAFSPNGNKVTGDFILKTGVNILTQFQILEDLIYSEISKVLDEIQAEDNYLYNSAFASNTNGWEAKNDIHFFTVNGKFLLVNGKFYSRKDTMAAIIRDEDRNVLRILSSGIKQSNADLANKPTYEEGEEPRKFFISFKYKVITAGTITIGFPGQNLHFTEQLEPGEEYTMKEYSGTWDGTGDFELKFTGDIYIHSLALTDNAYEDMITKFETQLSQTNEKIEAVAERTSNLESKSAGWLTTADGVEIWAAAEFENGIKASSLFNVSADEILLKSEHIRLEGSVSANGNVFINTDGTMIAKNMVAENGDFSGKINADEGFIGDFSISDGNIVISSGYNAMRMVLGNEGISYQRINPQISARLGLQKESILDAEKYTTISLKGYTSDFCGLKIHSGNSYGGIGIYLDEAPAILNNSALILNGFCPLILNSNTISAGGTYNCSWCMNQGGGTYDFYLPSSSEGRFGQMGSTIFVQNTNGDAWINTKNGETIRTLNGSSTTRWAFKNQFRLAIFHKMNYSTWTVNITE